MNNDINNISINDISENSLNFSKVKKYSYLITKRLFDIILSLFGIKYWLFQSEHIDFFGMNAIFF